MNSYPAISDEFAFGCTRRPVPCRHFRDECIFPPDCRRVFAHRHSMPNKLFEAYPGMKSGTRHRVDVANFFAPGD